MATDDVYGVYGVGSRLDALDDSSALSDVVSLNNVWLQEKLSPEILKYEAKLVADVMEQIENQRGNIDEIEPVNSTDALKVSLFQLELGRITFILEIYHRIRLEKIQEHCSILLRSSAIENLSENEIEFARKYSKGIEDHLDDSFLRFLPARLQNIRDIRMSKLGKKQHTQSHVIGVVDEDIGSVSLDDAGRQSVDLERGDTVISPYTLLSRFIKLGTIKLK